MTADQRFLLLFIFSHYFGPDLKDERPCKSVFQRIVEGLPPYATHELAVVATRFKKLTGLEFLFLDAEAALSYCRICGIADNMIEELDDEELAESSLPRSREMGMGNLRYVRPLHCLAPYNNRNNTSDNTEIHNNVTPLPTDTYNLHDESGMVFYPSDPTAEEWSEFVDAARKAFGFQGIAVEIQDGPLIGLLDIRVCEDAYWFRILLPGVKQDDNKLFMHFSLTFVLY
ncbi:hypothetical protein MRB53_031189 [Persea americana]|uniref:Uncharacterized protein n=1 Tax=Persea americana TaxID=3435 RepID=A0ACC2KNR2_PERAE|nr:hypothetical protein MRB53_031189 [Persea americana]